MLNTVSNLKMRTSGSITRVQHDILQNIWEDRDDSLNKKIISNWTQRNSIGCKNILMIHSVYNLLLILSVLFNTMILGNHFNQMASTNLTIPNSSSVHEMRWLVTTYLKSFVNTGKLIREQIYWSHTHYHYHLVQVKFCTVTGLSNNDWDLC